MLEFNTVYVGIDIHKKSISVCAFEPLGDTSFAAHKLGNDYEKLLHYLKTIPKLNHGTNIVCGYEAGCTGYALYRYLTSHNVKCRVIAPSTIEKSQSKRRIKTDRLDAKMLAKAMAYDTCKYVCVPSPELEVIREYIRMRNSHKRMLKVLKQKIKALCLLNNQLFENDSWNQEHFKWLRQLPLTPLLRETLDEYLLSYNELLEKITGFDKRIIELAAQPEYKQSVQKLACIKGIKPITAMTIISEIGDFNRFSTARQFSSFIGLTPGEHSSGDKIKHLPITKAGNIHVRKILIEASQTYVCCYYGHKSAELKKRQLGAPVEVIKYADHCSNRLRRKYVKLTTKGKQTNVAKTAIARELSGFIWGMMTGNYKVPGNGKVETQLSDE